GVVHQQASYGAPRAAHQLLTHETTFHATWLLHEDDHIASRSDGDISHAQTCDEKAPGGRRDASPSHAPLEDDETALRSGETSLTKPLLNDSLSAVLLDPLHGRVSRFHAVVHPAHDERRRFVGNVVLLEESASLGELFPETLAADRKEVQILAEQLF